MARSTGRTSSRSYCPPVVIDAAGKKQLVLTGSKCVASYDPDTGKQIWIIDGPTEQFVSSMVLHDGVLLMTAGFPVYWVMAIDPSGSGNVTKTHVLWSNKNEGGYVPSPVAHDGKLFLVDDKGVGELLGREDRQARLEGAARRQGPPRLGRRRRRPHLLHRRRRHDVRAESVGRVRGAGEEPAGREGVRLAGVLATATSSSAVRSTCGASGRSEAAASKECTLAQVYVLASHRLKARREKQGRQPSGGRHADE